jgi:hypothetical protein
MTFKGKSPAPCGPSSSAVSISGADKREQRFIPGIAATRELCWAKGKERIAAEAFPDRIVKILLDPFLRANQGKVEMPFL